MRSERELTVLELEIFCKKVGLNSFQTKQVIYLYDKLLAHGLTRGRDLKRTFAAITYSLSKKLEWKITMKKIATNINEDKYALFRTYRGLKRKTNLLT